MRKYAHGGWENVKKNCQENSRADKKNIWRKIGEEKNKKKKI